MTLPAIPVQPMPSSTAPTRARLGVNDPLLQELWAVEASLNAEADFQVEKIIERTRHFDLAATLERLKREVGNS